MIGFEGAGRPPRELAADFAARPAIISKGLWVWTAAITALFVASGMAYSLFWPSVVRHRNFYWATPNDFWASYRNAHYVAWGSISWIYGANTHLVTLPGLALLLAPVAALTGALNLTESAPAIFLWKPQAWLVAGPVMMLSVVPLLLGANRVAVQLGISAARRRLLIILEAAGAWPAIVWWGHPEDVLAIGFLLLGFAALAGGRDTAGGWFLGAAMAVQLLAILVIPVAIAYVGRKRFLPLLLRASVLPFFCLAVTIPDFGKAWTALTNQPNYPLVDHPTPWAALSPSLGHHVVAAGPARLIGFAVAAACGIAVLRVRDRPRPVLWLAAAAFAARCLFEAVMVPYYVMPVVALALICLCTLPLHRLLAGAATAAALSVVTFLHAGPWTYWGGMTALLAATLVIAWTGGWRFRKPSMTDSLASAPPQAVRSKSAHPRFVW